MFKFAANLTYLFTEYPLLDRFQAAADAGFEGVEVLFPYDDATTEIARALRQSAMPFVLMNGPPPNWTGGDRGFAAVPGLEARFQQDFRRAMRFAERLRPQHIHLMAGVAAGPQARTTFVENLKWAADRAPHQSLTIEPLNAKDMPGYFLQDFALAAEIIAEVDAPNVRLQFDLYHADMIHGDVIGLWEKYAAITRHIQIGGAPGRNEPQDSAVDLPAFFAAVEASGYDGFISGEYKPRADTLDGLAWMRQ
ncbi:MAG: TIM barrel protein [Pseudomonadota bacterium]